MDKYRSDWGIIEESVLDLEGTSLGEFTLAAGGFGEDVFAIIAGNHSLGMAEDDCCLVAASALYVHEVGVGGRH